MGVEVAEWTERSSIGDECREGGGGGGGFII
jgi:hypothetical protein